MNGTASEVESGVAMREEVGPAVAADRSAVVVAIPQLELARRLIERVKQIVPSASVLCVCTLEKLREAAKERQPQVIIADDRILGRVPLAESVAELATVAPVVLVAAYERHAEIGRMVAAGQADFVPRAPDWELLAASLAERRLYAPEISGISRRWRTAGLGDEMREIFRHEINNPLTGILGNAELLLAHSDKFPAAETQRIRTVVDLAVRLREAVRNVSDRWRR